MKYNSQRTIFKKEIQSKLAEISIKLKTDVSWYVANIKHAGFYRVNYDEQNWQLLIGQLKSEHELIDSVSRAQLLDDLYNLGRAEIINQSIYIDALEYLKKETHPMPFIPVFSSLDYISDMLASDYKVFDSFKVNKI